MNKYICVFDFETDGVDSSVCQPVQMAGLMIHPRTLEIVENSEFSSYMRPEGLDDENYIEEHKENMVWHAKNYGVTVEDVFKKWQDAPSQQIVWEQWITYLKKWNTNQSNRNMWSAPIRGGHNIRRFDIPIMDRLCTKYGDVQKSGEQKIFYPRDVVDIQEICFYWFENLPKPEAYNMDALREFYELPTHGGHDALNDIRDEAWIISKFMKLFRGQAPRIKFKGSGKNVNRD